MCETLKADFQRYFDLLPKNYRWWNRCMFFLSCQGMWAIADYRWRRWLLRQPRVVGLLLMPLVWCTHLLVETLTGISLPTGCIIGKGLYIGHFVGIFIFDTVVIGENCSLSQGVSIGVGGIGPRLGAPRIGHDVYFGAGCKVIGKITIGHRVHIGANAVVTRSVPDGATAVGVPARIVRTADEPAASGDDA